jgi:hypothetical protein
LGEVLVLATARSQSAPTGEAESNEGYQQMFRVKSLFASLPVVGAVVLGGASLSACATTEYVDQQVATVNGHLAQVEAKANDAGQKADAAMTQAQAAQSTAQAAQSTASAAQTAAASASASAQDASARVGTVEQKVAQAKQPRN